MKNITRSNVAWQMSHSKFVYDQKDFGKNIEVKKVWSKNVWAQEIFLVKKFFMCKSLVKKQDNFACKKIKEKVSNSVLGKGISVILMVIEEEQML